MARGDSKTSPRRLLAVERQVRALELRSQGWTFEQIAQSAGFNSRQAAHKSVSSAITRTTTGPDYVELAVEAERVDALFRSVFRAAMTGDQVAIKLTLAVMDRRAQLLDNLPTDCGCMNLLAVGKRRAR